MSGLNFCMVTTFYPPYNFGGDGIGIQRFCRGLVRAGHRVTVLQDIGGFELLSEGHADSVEDGDGVEIVRLRSRLEPLSVILTHQLGRPVIHGRRIERFMSDRAFDVINFHNVSLVGGPGILSAGDALKLYMAHEHWLVCPSHVLWRHGRELCTGRECLRCVLNYRRPPQLWRHTGYLERQLDQIDGFIAMSEFSRKKHKEFGFTREMEVVNYFLPDTAEPTPPSDGESPHERPYFLFVGRLEKIKGLDDVIPVFEQYPDADLLIAGDGTYASALRALAADNPRVRFIGHVTPEETERYYRNALALIVPSVCFETFGIIIIEAFRQRTPVIARRIGPFPEILERGGGGSLFETEEELLAAMRRFQQESGYREKCAAEAFAAFDTHWCESAVIPRYLETVKRAAQRSGRTQVVDALSD